MHDAPFSPEKLMAAVNQGRLWVYKHVDILSPNPLTQHRLLVFLKTRQEIFGSSKVDMNGNHLSL